MTRRSNRSTSSFEQSRVILAERLRARRTEIAQAVLTRMYAIADPSHVTDPEYLPGLRRAVIAAVEYGVLAVEVGEKRPMPLPVSLLGQARLAARNDVSLDTVLRRCVAGYALLTNFLEDEAARIDTLRPTEFKELRSSQTILLDRFLTALGDEYSRGNLERPDSSQALLAQRVMRLLEGELVDTSQISYDIESSHHIGAVIEGPEGPAAIRSLAKAFDSRLLLVNVESNISWAWLGRRGKIDRQQLARFIASTWPPDLPLALGEAGKGNTGWRLTHQQARATFAVLRKKGHQVAQYADVALLASIHQDKLLTSSLTDLYLLPLASEPDGGASLRETLRAYFASDRNNSAAAASLGVSRQTVASRLRTAEERIGRPLIACAADLEAALHLAELP